MRLFLIIIMIIMFVAMALFIINEVSKIEELEGPNSSTANDITKDLITLLPIAIIIIGVLGLISFIPQTLQPPKKPSPPSNPSFNEDVDPPGFPPERKIPTKGDYLLYNEVETLDEAMKLTRHLRENGYKAKINPLGNVLDEDKCKYEIYKSQWKEEDEIERGKPQWKKSKQYYS